MVRKSFTMVALCTLALVLSGCGKSHESIAKEVMVKFQDLDDVMKGITDEASAKAAPDKVKAIAADMKKLKEEDDSLGKLTKEEDEKIRNAHEAEMKTIQADMEKQMQRIMQDPKLAPSMMDVAKQMMDLGQTMTK